MSAIDALCDQLRRTKEKYLATGRRVHDGPFFELAPQPSLGRVTEVLRALPTVLEPVGRAQYGRLFEEDARRQARLHNFCVGVELSREMSEWELCEIMRDPDFAVIDIAHSGLTDGLFDLGNPAEDARLRITLTNAATDVERGRDRHVHRAIRDPYESYVRSYSARLLMQGALELAGLKLPAVDRIAESRLNVLARSNTLALAEKLPELLHPPGTEFNIPNAQHKPPNLWGVAVLRHVLRQLHTTDQAVLFEDLAVARAVALLRVPDPIRQAAQVRCGMITGESLRLDGRPLDGTFVGVRAFDAAVPEPQVELPDPVDWDPQLVVPEGTSTWRRPPQPPPPTPLRPR